MTAHARAESGDATVEAARHAGHARITLGPSRPASGGVDELESVAQFVARMLERMILLGEIRGGERLVQTELAARFGVSRVPIRDALAILVRKELAVSVPRKGLVVRTASERETRDLYELRMLLEDHAYASSLPLLTGEDRSRAGAIVARQADIDAADVVSLLDVDQQFHELLLSRCPNAELLATLSRLWVRIRILRAQVGEPRDWKTTSVQGHRRVLESVEAGDWDGACELLRRNIERSRDDILAHLPGERP